MMPKASVPRKSVPLTSDEIRLLDGYTRRYLVAQERANLLMELNEEYMTMLRAKYGLDETWTCSDVLVGFIQEAVSDD